MFRPTLFAALFAATFGAQAAATQPLTATQVLNQLNVVSLNEINSKSHVDGRTWAGGSVSGGDYGQQLSRAPASAYAGLSAGGAASNFNLNGGGIVVNGSVANANINGGVSVVKGGAVNTNFNGAAYVAGAAAFSNFNGPGRVSAPTTAMQAASAAATSTDFGKVLDKTSTAMSKLASTGSTVTVQGNKATFNAKANGNGVAVFDLTGIDEQLFKLGEYQFNLNGATTVILNSDVKSASINANFLGGGAQAIGSKTIWNFYDATSLTIGSQFGGAVLATDALLTNYQNIEGGVYVHDLKQYGEIHLQAFAGNVDFLAAPVPEPGTVAMLLAGLGILGAVRLRRGRQA